jgi:ribose-phosphate pyrophosphokinase
VQDKNVFLVDDLTITGRSLVEMAKTLKSRGAKEIYVGVTHGVLSEGAAARIAGSEIKKMFITDTIENSFDPLPHNIEVVSMSHLMAAAIRSIHDRTSISMLFPDKQGE